MEIQLDLSGAGRHSISLSPSKTQRTKTTGNVELEIGALQSSLQDLRHDIVAGQTQFKLFKKNMKLALSKMKDNSRPSGMITQLDISGFYRQRKMLLENRNAVLASLTENSEVVSESLNVTRSNVLSLNDEVQTLEDAIRVHEDTKTKLTNELEIERQERSKVERTLRQQAKELEAKVQETEVLFTEQLMKHRQELAAQTAVANEYRDSIALKLEFIQNQFRSESTAESLKTAIQTKTRNVNEIQRQNIESSRQLSELGFEVGLVRQQAESSFKAKQFLEEQVAQCKDKLAAKQELVSTLKHEEELRGTHRQSKWQLLRGRRASLTALAVRPQNKSPDTKHSEKVEKELHSKIHSLELESAILKEKLAAEKEKLENLNDLARENQSLREQANQLTKERDVSRTRQNRQAEIDRLNNSMVMKMFEDYSNSFYHWQLILNADVDDILGEYENRMADIQSTVFMLKPNKSFSRTKYPRDFVIVSQMRTVVQRFDEMSQFFQRRMDTAMTLFARRIGMVSRSIKRLCCDFFVHVTEVIVFATDDSDRLGSSRVAETTQPEVLSSNSPTAVSNRDGLKVDSSENSIDLFLRVSTKSRSDSLAAPIPAPEQLVFQDESGSLWERARQYQSDVVTLLEKEMERCESVWTATIDSQEKTIEEQRQTVQLLQRKLSNSEDRERLLREALNEAKQEFERVRNEKFVLIQQTTEQMDTYAQIIHQYQDVVDSEENAT